MDRACDDLLSGSALAGQEDGGIGVRDSIEQAMDTTHRRALARDPFVRTALTQLRAEYLHLGTKCAV